MTFFYFLSLKNDVNVTSKRNKQKNFEKKIYFFVGIVKVNDENSRGLDADLDPYQNVIDPQHCFCGIVGSGSNPDPTFFIEKTVKFWQFYF